MNEIRYCLPSADNDDEAYQRGQVVPIRSNGGGSGGGAKGNGKNDKSYHVDYQNLNWVLDTKRLIEEEEGPEEAHQVRNMIIELNP